MRRSLGDARRCRRVLLLLAGPLVAAGLVSCGSSGHSNSSSVTGHVVNNLQKITVKAGDDLRFSPAKITVHPGQVKLTLENTGKGAPHNWTLPQFPADFVATTAAGTTKSAYFIAPLPGTYQFVCTIHEKQGQTGTLVVLPK